MVTTCVVVIANHSKLNRILLKDVHARIGTRNVFSLSPERKPFFGAGWMMKHSNFLYNSYVSSMKKSVQDGRTAHKFTHNIFLITFTFSLDEFHVFLCSPSLCLSLSTLCIRFSFVRIFHRFPTPARIFYQLLLFSANQESDTVVVLFIRAVTSVTFEHTLPSSYVILHIVFPYPLSPFRFHVSPSCPTLYLISLFSSFFRPLLVEKAGECVNIATIHSCISKFRCTLPLSPFLAEDTHCPYRQASNGDVCIE